MKDVVDLCIFLKELMCNAIESFDLKTIMFGPQYMVS